MFSEVARNAVVLGQVPHLKVLFSLLQRLIYKYPFNSSVDIGRLSLMLNIIYGGWCMSMIMRMNEAIANWVSVALSLTKIYQRRLTKHRIVPCWKSIFFTHSTFLFSVHVIIF